VGVAKTQDGSASWSNAGPGFTGRADIWSYGAVLWELLTGERLISARHGSPFKGSSRIRVPLHIAMEAADLSFLMLGDSFRAGDFSWPEPQKP
jgi:hypothetical protein